MKIIAEFENSMGPGETSFNKQGAPVAQWVKRWPTDLADQVQSPLEVKSSEP